MSHDFWNLSLKVQNYSQIFKTISYFSAFDSVFNCIKHFFQNTTHNSLPKTQRSMRKWLAFLFSNTTNQNATLIHQVTQTHSSQCVNTNCFTDHLPITALLYSSIDRPINRSKVRLPVLAICTPPPCQILDRDRTQFTVFYCKEYTFGLHVYSFVVC